MTIIKEMQREAHLAPTSSLEYLEQCITRWADALEASGAMVPVKVGEECELIHVRIGEHVIIDKKIYWYHGGDMDAHHGYLRSIPGMDAENLSMDTIAQPVRLVPLAEWSPEGVSDG